jgi:two-component system, sensor histidine kinase
MSDKLPANPGIDLASFERFLNEPALHEQIIGSFCHDLRQPLQSALMRLAALKRADAQGQNRELLEDLYLSLREIATMSETVFDTIRLSRATIAGQQNAVAVDDLLRRVQADFRGLAEHNKLRLSVRASPYVVVTDETLVTRIVSHLVHNALNYTKRGGVLVAPRLHGGQLCFEVWDTGPGIAAEQFERIFTAFARGTSENEVARSSGCTGLGLWNAREFARLIGGSITVHSRVGRGSVFRLRLPGDVEERPVPRTRALAEASRADGPIALLGTDTAAILEQQRLVLRSGGKHVSFRDAIELLSYLNVPLNRPQIVLLNFEAGPLDLDFLIRILQSRFADLPCVVLADDMKHPRIVELRRIGAQVLEKPLTAARLSAVIRSGGRVPAEGSTHALRERRASPRTATLLGSADSAASPIGSLLP